MIIAYPFAVKHNGIEYAPNAEIEVADKDAEMYLAQGAVEIRTPVTEDVPAKGRKKK